MRIHITGKLIGLFLLFTALVFIGGNKNGYLNSDTDVNKIIFTTHTIDLSDADYFNAYRERSLIMSTALAVTDIDNNGYEDILVLGHTTSNPNAFFILNQPDGYTIKPALDWGIGSTGMGMGAVFADFDQDGDEDLAVHSFMSPGLIEIYYRDGQIFNKQHHIKKDMVVGPSLFDYDYDGDIDLLYGTYTDQSPFILENKGREFSEVPQHLNKDLTWGGIDMWEGPVPHGQDCGLMDTKRNGPGNFYDLSVQTADIDRDGLTDILMSADFGRSYVLHATGNNSFEDISNTLPLSDCNGMGSVVGDINNDGNIDWLITNIYDVDLQEYEIKIGKGWGANGNRLYYGDGEGGFTDVSERTSIVDGAWAWGACSADFNNDRRVDIAHVNGFAVEDAPFRFYENKTRVFIQNVNGVFVNIANQSGISDTNEERALVCFDIDHDGDIDMISVSVEGIVSIRENLIGNSKGFISIDLLGTEAQIIGSSVTITDSSDHSIVQHAYVVGGSSYNSQSSRIQHFGIGNSRVVDIDVLWGDGSHTIKTGIGANQRVKIDR